MTTAPAPPEVLLLQACSLAGDNCTAGTCPGPPGPGSGKIAALWPSCSKYLLELLGTLGPECFRIHAAFLKGGASGGLGFSPALVHCCPNRWGMATMMERFTYIIPMYLVLDCMALRHFDDGSGRGHQPHGHRVGAVMTFVLYGLPPVGIVGYILAPITQTRHQGARDGRAGRLRRSTGPGGGGARLNRARWWRPDARCRRAMPCRGWEKNRADWVTVHHAACCHCHNARDAHGSQAQTGQARQIGQPFALLVGDKQSRRCIGHQQQNASRTSGPTSKPAGRCKAPAPGQGAAGYRFNFQCCLLHFDSCLRFLISARA